MWDTPGWLSYICFDTTVFRFSNISKSLFPATCVFNSIHRVSLPTLFPAMDRTTPVHNADAHAGSDPRHTQARPDGLTGQVTAL